MEFVRGIHNLKSHHCGCAVAIGNFDGFHRGHQSLIVKLQEIRCTRGLPVMVMIFEPHPRERFLGSVRLSSFRDKFNYFSDFGVDVLLCVLFNSKFSSLDPYSFVCNVLVQQLKVRLICVGDNFRFGASRQGCVNVLTTMSMKFGFEVLKVNICIDDFGTPISSTIIRKMLKKGELTKVEMLLGRPYSISGRVVHGVQLGSLIGFPTLNVLLKGRKLPISGVYAVKVYGICNTPLLGVANIGICPTVRKCHQHRLEVHLLDQVIDIYGYYVQVILCCKIRNEECFFSLAALRNQIKNDIKIAREYFHKR